LNACIFRDTIKGVVVEISEVSQEIFEKLNCTGVIIMPKHTKKYSDSLNESLKDPKEAAVYLNAHLEEGESDEMFLLALRDVARAHGFSEIAEQSSLGRESLYKALSENGNPKLSTLKALLRTMGLKISISSSKSA